MAWWASTFGPFLARTQRAARARTGLRVASATSSSQSATSAGSAELVNETAVGLRRERTVIAPQSRLAIQGGGPSIPGAPWGREPARAASHAAAKLKQKADRPWLPLIHPKPLPQRRGRSL